VTGSPIISSITDILDGIIALQPRSDARVLVYPPLRSVRARINTGMENHGRSERSGGGLSQAVA